MEAYVRGGVCWPTYVEPVDPVSADDPQGGDYKGFIILAGQDVKTKKVHVFEQREFSTVDNVLDNGLIAFQGIVDFLNTGWSTYFCRKYFWNQPDESTKRYRLDVVRLNTITPKPSFIEAPWADGLDARAIVAKFAKFGWLAIDKDSILADEILQAGYDEKEALKTRPAIHALQCLLSGIDRWPWRDIT
jgi:hypothetical protein